MLGTYLKCMEVACQVLHGHFGPVYELQVSKKMMKNVASENNLALVVRTTRSVAMEENYFFRMFSTKARLNVIWSERKKNK